MKMFFKTVIMVFSIMHIMTLSSYAYDNNQNWRDVENSIYKHLKNRDSNFSFIYKGSRKEFEENIRDSIKNAYSKDDYIERSWIQIKPMAVITKNGIETTLNVTYLISSEQEKYVDSQLKSIVKSVINRKMTDLEKVKAINDYIIRKYEYDTSLKSISVYSSLTTSLATCQGYSMTAYKMLNYAGIENRIIVGRINNIPHSWNCVKIDGNWYQLDITNNDSIEKNKYFLVGDNLLIDSNYIWDADKYPKAVKSYF